MTTSNTQTHSHHGIFGKKTELYFAVLSGFFLLIGFLLERFSEFPISLWKTVYAFSYFFGGYFVSVEASKKLRKGDQLPSINSIRNDNNLSRDTVMLAFNKLKERGIVEAIPGKGYFIKSEDTKAKKICETQQELCFCNFICRLPYLSALLQE